MSCLRFTLKTVSFIINDIDSLEISIITDVNSTINLLNENKFINDDKILTNKGNIAVNIKIVNSLVLTDLLIETNYFEKLTSYEIIGLLSCFLELKISEDYKQHSPSIKNNKINIDNLNDSINKLVNLNQKYDIEMIYVLI